MCGVVPGECPAAVDPGTSAVVQGAVTDAADGSPVAGAYVRLLDDSGEFTAEVVSSATGGYRFFAAPGRWTVRALAPGRQGSAVVDASGGRVVEQELVLSA